MRKTKIICTLGPAVDNEFILKELMLKGMNAARFNFSHGTHEEKKVLLDKFKKVRSELGLPIATILDTKGPEIRIKSFASGSVTLQKGNAFTLYTNDADGDQNGVSITYKELYMQIKPGCRILIDDGLVELVVVEIMDNDIHCVVLNGGTISNSKSINVPNTPIDLPALTEKDIEDIKFGIENDFDFIAASFVRKASDVLAIRKVLKKYGGEDIRIISKIENREGVDNIDSIIEVSDAIMVARGDLGVEIPAYEVPIIQKKIIAKSCMNGKPAITATQMLDSMMRNPRPTRAETSDVANAVFDSTSVVMLSGETASGKYPVESVETMANIITTTERAIDYWNNLREGNYNLKISKNISNAISHTSCTTAMDLNADAIITVTQTGETARMIARFRPQCPIVAVTVCEKVQRQLAISWGVCPGLAAPVESTDELFEIGVEKAVEMKVVSEGDTVVITSGVPIGRSGTTNLIKAQVV